MSYPASMQKIRSYPIEIGGLFRCCIENIKAQDEEAEPHQFLICPHCADRVQLHRDGAGWVWRWTPVRPYVRDSA